jgi:hypothetical protein
MMKTFISGLFLCVGVFTTTQAFALSQPCRTAASLGGPCGCVASEHLGLTDRSLWAVSSWYRFPKTDCHAGAAALWGRRHVEAVTGCENGVAITNGPYGVRRTPIGRLSFVQPGGTAHPTEFAAGTEASTHVAVKSRVHVAARVHTRHYASNHYHRQAMQRYAQAYHSDNYESRPRYGRNRQVAEVHVSGYGYSN